MATLLMIIKHVMYIFAFQIHFFQSFLHNLEMSSGYNSSFYNRQCSTVMTILATRYYFCLATVLHNSGYVNESDWLILLPFAVGSLDPLYPSNYVV